MRNSFAGSYTHIDSPIHKAPAGLKMAIAFVLGPSILLFMNFYALSLTTMATLLILILAKGNPFKILRDLWPSYPFLALIFLSHLIGDGLTSGIITIWRISLVLLISLTVTYTTSSREMASVFERAFRIIPIKPLGITSRDISLMLILSIRFFPIFFEEMKRIKKVNMARGFDPRKVGFKKGMRFLVLLIIALLNGLFKRAGEVSKAIEARGYLAGWGHIPKQGT
jgi:energy-coupling factor transporter transmembrane protein EcfT